MGLKYLYDKIYNRTKREREKFIIDQIITKPNSKILLLGFSENTANKILKSTSVQTLYTVDIKIRVNKKKQFIIKQADLNNSIPFDNNFFDFIIADQVIEHLTNPDTFLEEIYRTLNPTGKAIISTENLAHIRNIISLLLGYSPMNINYSNKINVGNPLSPYHKNKVSDIYMCHHKVFTPRALEELLIFYNFKITDKKYSNLINPIVFKKYCYFMTYVVQKKCIF